MKTNRTLGYLALGAGILFLAIGFLLSGSTAAPKKKTIDQSRSILQRGRIANFNEDQSVKMIVDYIKRETGTDLNQRHFHLALGVATGHFNDGEPIEQIITRISRSLFNNYLIEGDHLSLFSYEWHLKNDSNSCFWYHPFNEDAQHRIPEVWLNFIKREGGTGYNQVILEALKAMKIESLPHNLVIILLSSQINSNQPVIPQDPMSPITKDTLHRYGLQLLEGMDIPYSWVPFEKNGVSQPASDVRTLHIQSVVSDPFDGEKMEASRSASLKSVKNPISFAPTNKINRPIPPRNVASASYMILGAILIMLGATMLFNAPTGSLLATIRIRGNGIEGSWSMKGTWKTNETVLRVVGPKLTNTRNEDKVVGGEDMPPVILFEIKESGSGLRLSSGTRSLTLTSGRTIASQSGFVLTPGSHRFNLHGDVNPVTDGVPVTVDLDVEVSIKWEK